MISAVTDEFINYCRNGGRGMVFNATFNNICNYI